MARLSVPCLLRQALFSEFLCLYTKSSDQTPCPPPSKFEKREAFYSALCSHCHFALAPGSVVSLSTRAQPELTSHAGPFWLLRLQLVSCDSDDECDEVCGVHPKRYQDGSFIGGVEGGSCGEHVGWVSAGGACAGGWDTDEFPDSFPYYCGTAAADDNEMANMYGCFGGSLGHSGYTAGATSSSCGCPDWEGDPFYLTVSKGRTGAFLPFVCCRARSFYIFLTVKSTSRRSSCLSCR